jgi:hypothetical protein
MLKFPEFYGTRKFFIVFTAARLDTCPYPEPDQFPNGPKQIGMAIKRVLLTAIVFVVRCGSGNALRVVAYSFLNLPKYGNGKQMAYVALCVCVYHKSFYPQLLVYISSWV